MYYKTTYLSPLGVLTLVCNNDLQLIGLWIESEKYNSNNISDEIIQNDNLKIFDITKSWLDLYFAGKNPPINTLPLKPIGSEFRQKAWKILKTIPYGQLMTYGQIAEIIAKQMGKEKMSSQAVGGAVSHNPIEIIIPCHRVVGSNNKLTGYFTGLDNKEFLLNLEGIDLDKFTR